MLTTPTDPPISLTHNGDTVIVTETGLDRTTSVSVINITLSAVWDYRINCSVAMPTVVKGILGSEEIVLPVKGEV